jgi:hypothetical protein
MTETYSAEIYRQEGAAFRSIRLYIHADGSVKLDAQDMGITLTPGYLINS